MNANNTTPVANNNSWCDWVAYPISKAILLVRGLTLSKIDVGIWTEFPPTNIIAIVSPIALPQPKTIAASIPDFAAGTTTLNVVSICEAPSARDPSYNFLEQPLLQ